MSHCNWFTTSCDGLIGYSKSGHAVVDVIGWGRGVQADLHVLLSCSWEGSRDELNCI